jgi:hypothetical protein
VGTKLIVPSSPESFTDLAFQVQTGKLWPVLHSLVLLELMGFPNGDFGERLNNLWQNLDLEGQHDESELVVDLSPVKRRFFL